MSLGLLAEDRERWDDALTSYRQALAIVQEQGAHNAQVRILWNIGRAQRGAPAREPARRPVEQADSLVAETMKRLAEVFAEERSKLEQQWDRGGDVSTEDLRLTLQRYRSFFTRLLSV